MSLNNYHLFHSFAELFSISVSLGVLLIVWNARNYQDNSFLLLIGISFLPIGVMDLINMLAYKSMGVFLDVELFSDTALDCCQNYSKHLPVHCFNYVKSS